MSLGLAVFHHLCEAGNALEALREGVPPGSDAWCALTQLVQCLDTCIDALVTSPALEEGDDDA